MTGVLARIGRIAGSLRTSVVLMVALTCVLVAGVAVPQQAVVGERAVTAAAAGSAVAAMVLVRMRLSAIATSPLFLGIVAMFFVNLVTVLASRTAPVVRRVRRATPAAASLTRWTNAPGARVVPLPPGWSSHTAARTLRGFGYRTMRVGDHALWGVKHRSAPIGFLLFHVSFVVLLCGGALIWATRFVAETRLTEGETFSGRYRSVARHAPAGDPRPAPFTALAIEPRFERGEATDLATRLDFGGVERLSRVNDPATWGAESILISDVGVSPVVWLQDPRGFTIDRIAVACEHSAPTRAAIGPYAVEIAPRVRKESFPTRDALRDVAVDVTLRDAGGVRYRGTLTPGRYARFDGGMLTIPEVRYWAALRIVSERGGALLVAGFVAAVAGLAWRMLAQRREIAVTWDDAFVRVAGFDEFFPYRFRGELDDVGRRLGGEA